MTAAATVATAVLMWRQGRDAVPVAHGVVLGDELSIRVLNPGSVPIGVVGCVVAGKPVACTSGSDPWGIAPGGAEHVRFALPQHLHDAAVLPKTVLMVQRNARVTRIKVQAMMTSRTE